MQDDPEVTVMTYRGEVRGGVVVLDAEVRLPEGTVVSVEAPASPGEQPADDPLFSMGDMAVDTGVSDLATNIDHYLYGHPKADHGR